MKTYRTFILFLKPLQYDYDTGHKVARAMSPIVLGGFIVGTVPESAWYYAVDHINDNTRRAV